MRGLLTETSAAGAGADVLVRRPMTALRPPPPTNVARDGRCRARLPAHVLRPDRPCSDREAEGRPPMSYSHSIPPTVQIRRGHLLGLIGVVAALAACITWVVTAFAFDTGASGAVSARPASPRRRVSRRPSPRPASRSKRSRRWHRSRPRRPSPRPEAQIGVLSTMALQNVRHDDPIMWMTPAQLAGLGLGTGYQLPERAELADRGGHPGFDEPADTAVHRVGHEPHVQPARRGRRGPALAPRLRGEVLPLPSTAGRRRVDGLPEPSVSKGLVWLSGRIWFEHRDCGLLGGHG